MAAIDLGSCDQGAEFEIFFTFTDPDDSNALVSPTPLTVTVICLLTNTTVVYTLGGGSPQDANFVTVSSGRCRLRVDTTASAGKYTGYTRTPTGNAFQQTKKFEFYVNPVP